MQAKRLTSTAGYAADADKLASQYESVTFAEVHRDTLHLLPQAPARILDIGAGSGRDAAALSALGHDVLAVEPTRELREHGQRLHSGSTIAWLDDGLPELAGVLARRETFDRIYLTAVWMHLDAPERAVAMARLGSLLGPRGLIIMSLRHGPIPVGRRMFDVSPDETVSLAQRCGLCVVHRSERDDMLGRRDVTWSILAFQPAQ